MAMIHIKSLTNNATMFECENRGETFKRMHHFFRNRKFCDVVLVAGNDSTRVSAHRIVISAASDYFLDLLEKSTTSEITLEGVDGDILNTLVNFIYTAKLELCGDTVDSIMRTATRLKLGTVVTECSDFLAGRLCISNCLPVAVFSEQQDYPDLCEKSFMYACQNFMELIKEESFLQLAVEPLCKLLARNDLCVKSEENVFHALFMWIQHDKVNRDKYTFKLLSHLRFPLLKPEFIANEIEEACQSPECQGLIIKAFKWHMSAAPRSLFPGELCSPRNQKREIILMKTGTEQDMSLVAETFDPLGSGWTHQEWPAKPKLGWYSNGILINGKVYLAGTTVQQSNEISCVDCLDLTTKLWTELPSMTSYRYSFGMASLNGLLYAIGGKDNTGNLRTVEKWDPTSPLRWQEVAPMKVARSQPCVTVLNGLLYVLGKSNDFDRSTFECYDSQTDTWTDLTPPNKARASVGLSAVKGYLYSIGARTKAGTSSIVERYDPKADSWTEIAVSERFQQYQQCVASLDRLIVLVELEEGRTIHVLEEYDPETEQWRTMNPLQRYHGKVIMILK